MHERSRTEHNYSCSTHDIGVGAGKGGKGQWPIHYRKYPTTGHNVLSKLLGSSSMTAEDWDHQMSARFLGEALSATRDLQTPPPTPPREAGPNKK